jgi:competence protein ComEC
LVYQLKIQLCYPIAIGLLLGCFGLLHCAQLPSVMFIITLSGAALLIHSVAIWRNNMGAEYGWTWLLLAVSLGFSWCYVHSQHILSWQLPAIVVNQPVKIVGTVHHLPILEHGSYQLTLRLTELCAPQLKDWVTQPTLVKLSGIHSQQPLQPGDSLTMIAKLKPPHGLSNPGTFDLEQYYFLQRIRAIGRVQQVLVHVPSSKSLRYQLWQVVQATLQEAPFQGILTALIMGHNSDISAAQWAVLRATGTSHLVAISGLHVGAVAMLAYCIGSWVWTRSYRALHYLATPYIGALCGVSSACCYAHLAGWSIPTLRAAVMVSVHLLGVALPFRISAPQRWLWALTAVLLLDPLAPCSAGFWLSFIAVGILLAAVNTSHRGWRQWLWPQWVMFIGLAPLTLIFFQQLSFISPLANAVAIPWLSFMVMPLALIGGLFSLICPPLGAIGLKAAHGAFAILWPGLCWLAQNPWSQWQSGPLNYGLLGLMGLGSGILLLPKGVPGRYIGWCGWLPLVLNLTPPMPAWGHLQLTLLDVGQGLAVIVKTQTHQLLYDTGPRYGPQHDAGQRVIVPYLKQQSIAALDKVIISHLDLDHRGGLASLAASYPVQQFVACDPLAETPITELCRAGQSWEWDGVYFTFLSPTPPLAAQRNNRSCVLKIRTAAVEILLVGDIEKKIEQCLVAEQPQALRSHILVVPHHGSRSASSAEFVQAVAPEYALFSLGANNGYHFPHFEIITRYQQSGAKLLRTDQMGAITFFNLGHTLPSPQLWRLSTQRFWHAT